MCIIHCIWLWLASPNKGPLPFSSFLFQQASSLSDDSTYLLSNFGSPGRPANYIEIKLTKREAVDGLLLVCWMGMTLSMQQRGAEFQMQMTSIRSTVAGSTHRIAISDWLMVLHNLSIPQSCTYESVYWTKVGCDSERDIEGGKSHRMVHAGGTLCTSMTHHRVRVKHSPFKPAPLNFYTHVCTYKKNTKHEITW